MGRLTAATIGALLILLGAIAVTAPKATAPQVQKANGAIRIDVPAEPLAGYCVPEPPSLAVPQSTPRQVGLGVFGPVSRCLQLLELSELRVQLKQAELTGDAPRVVGLTAIIAARQKALPSPNWTGPPRVGSS